jgi:hypothetical protein
MAKSKKKSEDLNTAEEYYKSGEYYYKLGQEKSQLGEGGKVLEACGKSASKDFWNALTLGHGRAAYPLYLCFDEGIGVNKNDYIAKLMFGVALKFNDTRCIGDQVTIPKSMQSNINSLAKLVQNTHSKLPAEGVSMEIVFEQMDIFNKAIKLPSGKLIQSCFTEKSTATSNAYDGASSSQHNASYETCPDTSDSEADIALAGSTKLYMCCEIL